MTDDAAALLRAFHAANAGLTSRVLARGTTYARLADAVRGAGRVLDVGCGDGHLLRMLGPRAVGLDLSLDELALARPHHPVVQARAEAMPFADGAFDAAVAHLVLDLCADGERVVREMARVVRPGGTLAAIVGGGPTADGDDALHAYGRLAPPPRVAIGDRRTRDERVWQHWIPSATITRFTVDLSGSFADVWQFLGSGYELFERDPASIREALHAELGDTPSLTVVFFLIVAPI